MTVKVVKINGADTTIGVFDMKRLPKPNENIRIHEHSYKVINIETVLNVAEESYTVYVIS